MAKLISNRGYSFCGVQFYKFIQCFRSRLSTIPAEYGSDPSEVLDTFPLNLRICKDCGLGRLRICSTRTNIS